MCVLKKIAVAFVKMLKTSCFALQKCRWRMWTMVKKSVFWEHVFEAWSWGSILYSRWGVFVFLSESVFFLVFVFV